MLAFITRIVMKRLPQFFIPSCAIALVTLLCTESMARDKPSGLKVTATLPAHPVANSGGLFKARLLVENPTGKAIRFATITCSWSDNWKTDSEEVGIIPWSCLANVYEAIEIQPGGSFTDEFEIWIDPKTTPSKVSFRFGFASLDSKETSWSNKVEIQINAHAPGFDDTLEQNAMKRGGTRTFGKGCTKVAIKRSPEKAVN